LGCPFFLLEEKNFPFSHTRHGTGAPGTNTQQNNLPGLAYANEILLPPLHAYVEQAVRALFLSLLG